MKLSEAFTKNNDRSTDVYFTSEQPLLRDCTHIKVSIYYSLGGMNYFTGRQDPRGYNVSVSVVTRKSERGYVSESLHLGEGFRSFIAPANRFNRKKLEEIHAAALERAHEIIANHKTKYFAPDHRPLSAIAREIRQLWNNVYFGAVPYLEAMMQLTSIDDKYYEDDARSVVAYFLANAQTWRGEDAKRVKAELKALL